MEKMFNLTSTEIEWIRQALVSLIDDYTNDMLKNGITSSDRMLLDDLNTLLDKFG